LKKHQVNTMVYTMGDKADDILRFQGLTDEQKNEYATVNKNFEDNFVTCSPYIREGQIQPKSQKEGESVDSFVMDMQSWLNIVGMAPFLMR